MKSKTEALTKEKLYQEISWVQVVKNALPIYIQLGLVAVVIYFFRIEEDLELTEFWPILCGIFVIHSVAPKSIRPYLFFLGFIATLSNFLGVITAAKMLIMGIGILTVCHLPIPKHLKRIMVLGIGIMLVLMIQGYIWSPLSEPHLRIFGTILMFRVILYLYEIEHEKTHVSIIQRVNYFFLFPNIILPLFPIVDYQKFHSDYYNERDTIIYQKGINLIVWSLLCLLFYRFLYHFVVPDSAQLYDLKKTVIYIISNYVSVIRLVGLLGLAVGILRLFGYNLPPIFNYMFFASSFADLFRRINIYWKDFLMKVCYYPSYFRFRKISARWALTLATLVTFFFTWFFHAYQWFWVLGTNPFTETSWIYWTIFGIVATINTLFERKKKREKIQANFKYISVHTFKVFTTFILMALLYSLWMSPTLKIWTVMIATASNDSFTNWIEVIGTTLILFVLSCICLWVYLKSNNKINELRHFFNRHKIILNISVLVTLLTLGGLNQGSSANLKKFIKNEQMNWNDIDKEYAGYYSEILDRNFNIASRKLAKTYLNKQKRRRQSYRDMDIIRESNNVMGYEFIPSSTSTFKDKVISSNKWGFRDKDYDKEASPNTIRFAIVGASPTMGSGVADEEVAEVLVEKHLNKNFGSDSLKFELINFAMPSTCNFHYAYLIDSLIHQFSPDYLLLMDHCRSPNGYYRRVEKTIDRGFPMYPALTEFLKKNNINKTMVNTPTEKTQAGWLIAEFGYAHIFKMCLKYNIEPIWVFVPPVSKDYYLEEYKKLVTESGFQQLFILENAYENYSQKILQVAENDFHPNKKGQELIALALQNKLIEFLNLENNIKE